MIPIRSALLGALLVALTHPALTETIPTRHFFDNAQVREMRIAPDGEHIAFTFESGSEVQLTVLDLESMQLTTAPFGFGDNQHVQDFWWASDTRVVMSVATVTGNLDTLQAGPRPLYAANIDGSRRQEIFGASNLAGYQVLHPLPDDPDHILIARYHLADEGEPSAMLLNVFDGRTRYLADSPDSRNVSAFIADNAGELRAAIEFIDAENFDEMEFNLFVKHDDQWRELQVDSERERPSITPLGFSADNQRMYFLSNHDMAENDRSGAFRYDFESGDLELLFRHPQVDVSGAIRGHDDEVLGVVSRFGPLTYAFFEDKAAEHPDARLLQQLARSFPENDVSLTSFSRDGKRAVLFVRGDRNPGEFFLFHTDKLQAEFLAATRPELPKERLSPMRALEIPARDGLNLHGLLTTPADAQQPLPLIVNVHGGPFGITDRWGFNPEAQFFAHHGYATLQVNFRGSGNRGEDFVRKGRRQWGQAMQNDVTDATRWAIEQGIADPERICIMGGSYGGYATLMGLITAPELYECGVGIVGVYDLVWFREGDGSDFSRGSDRQSRMAFERFMSSHVAASTDGLEAYSPVHLADHIEDEVFIVHGGSDVRVPVGHAERLRDALDARGKPYRWMLKQEEGHGFFDVDNRVELYDAVLAFFNDHIGE
ncbi:alpha/beta hydrolase family protein [Wenzhouxiangella limi]|uniref:S9 family peptidase n=1 Tax=Wenzhouxiangella limi TaxID=2707351 RepID=A0A845UVM9_9GAMM|nr:S9 family peptidase [Wenzhouxiangella limi]NDY94594.1 S9 family peptidase [Wenzhouxiangella limi]